MQDPIPTKIRPVLPVKIGLGLAVGLLLTLWWINTPNGWLGKAVAIGYAICHRIAERSYNLDGQPMPICARCTGLYLGALVGLVVQFGRGRLGGYPARRYWILFGMLGLAYAVDGINSFLQLLAFGGPAPLYPPSNALRLITGTGMGLTLAVMLYPAFVQTTWRDWKNRPALSDPAWLAVLLSLALGMDGLFLAEIPLINKLLAVILPLTAVFVLSLVYTMGVVLLFKVENRFLTFQQLLFPLLGGFGIALLQVALIDWLRYTLTGTWDGFIVGFR